MVLPTFNRAGTIARAIASVLDQSFADLELIVVDDASTDGTDAVVATFEDRRLRYVRLPANKGVAHARNVGVSQALGTWLAFQDSDDEWLPTKLEEQTAVARRSDAPLILGGYRVSDGTTTGTITPGHLLSGEDVTPDILDGWPIITPTWLVRRELVQRLGGFDETFRCLEDWDLVFRMTKEADTAAVPGPVLIKHGSADTVTGRIDDLAVALAEILRRHGGRWRGHPHCFAHRLTHLGCLQFHLGQRWRARRTLARALAHHPASIPILATLLASLLGGSMLTRAERRWPTVTSMTLDASATP